MEWVNYCNITVLYFQLQGARFEVRCGQTTTSTHFFNFSLANPCVMVVRFTEMIHCTTCSTTADPFLKLIQRLLVSNRKVRSHTTP